MAGGFDKWLLLKIFQFGFVLACLICKQVTDDEESRLFLYLQKISREWPFLNRVTWDRVGSTVADTAYGGFLIITLGMIIGRAIKELPTKRRAMERFFLGIGSALFIVLGGLEFAALESLPSELIDNAAVLGSLSLVTGLLFLIDLAAPGLKESTKQSQTSAHLQLKPLEIPPGNGIRKEEANGKRQVNGTDKSKLINDTNNKQKQTRFDIYGNDKDDETVVEHPVQMVKHSPVFSQVRKPQYGQYDNVSPTYLRFQSDVDAPPSTPADPGYVQYTAKRWGQPSQKTPKHSPTAV